MAHKAPERSLAVKKTWKLMGAAALTSALLMTAVCAAEGLGSGWGDDDNLNNFSSLWEEQLGNSADLFENYDLGEEDMISAGDSFADSGDVIALDDHGISITVKDYYLVKEDEYGMVYVFVEGEYIPLVMINSFNTGWDVIPNGFDEMFIQLMQEDHPDTRQVGEAYTLTLAGREFLYIGYEYALQGYTTTDNRMFCQWNNKTYMFAGKEISALGDVLPDSYLEQIAASMAPLTGGDADYANHVDSTRSVSGPGPSIGLGTNTTGTDGAPTGKDDGPEEPKATVGGPVGSGGPVGREPDDGTSGSVTFDESLADYQGVWVEFADGFKLYLPTDWNTYNLTQQQRDAGMFYMAGDTSGAALPPGVGVSYGEKGDLTLEEIAQMFREDGCDVDGIISVNGIPCVSYVSEQENCCGLVFFHPEGLDYFFMVQAFNYSESVDTLAAVICSLTLTA